MDTSTVITLFLRYRYPALTVLAIFEGPYVMMMCGLLVKLGVLDLVPTYIALSIGDLIGDVAWYYIGYFFGDAFVRRFGRFLDITAENVESAKLLFSNHRRKILLGSKATAGFGLSLATLVAAGTARVPFLEFVLLNFFGQLAWTGTMLAVGYFFGNLYVAIDNTLGRIFLIGAALLILYLLLRFFRHLGRRAKKRISEQSTGSL